MSQLPEGRPPTVTQVRPGSRQPSTQSHFHAEPVFLVRQSTGSSSHLETILESKRGPGIRPFAHRSGIRAMLGEQQKQQEQQCPSPLVRSPNCHGKQDPGPSKQALPCASGSRPKGVFPSGGSSAVTFLHVLGRQGRGLASTLREAPHLTWFHFSFSSLPDTCETRALGQRICCCAQGLLHTK